MPRAKKPAPSPAEKKPSVTSTLSWKLARTDLSCGHSVTRLPEHNRQEEIWCLGCEAMRSKKPA